MTDTLTNSERSDVRRYCGYPEPNPTCLLDFRLNRLTSQEAEVVRRYLMIVIDADDSSNWVGYASDKNELREVIDDRRQRLCAFLGVPPGPAFSNTVKVSA